MINTIILAALFSIGDCTVVKPDMKYGKVTDEDYHKITQVGALEYTFVYKGAISGKLIELSMDQQLMEYYFKKTDCPEWLE